VAKIRRILGELTRETPPPPPPPPPLALKGVSSVKF
jgi:hypothetical protein